MACGLCVWHTEDWGWDKQQSQKHKREKAELKIRQERGPKKGQAGRVQG